MSLLSNDNRSRTKTNVTPINFGFFIVGVLKLDSKRPDCIEEGAMKHTSLRNSMLI